MPFESERQEPELVAVQTFTNEPEAYLAKGALEAFGVQCILEGDEWGSRPHIAARPLRLMVRAEDAARAAEILQTPRQAER